MNDMTKFIAPKADQLTADDLLSGDITITITGVSIRSDAEQPCNISFEGDGGKPWRPCKTVGRILVKAWGPDANQYVGKSVQLFRDPTVKWAGMNVGGVRIRALSHIDRAFEMALTETRGKKNAVRVLPLKLTGAGAAPSKGYDFIAGIEACASAAHLKQWRKDHGDAIPADIEDAVTDAFNARWSLLKTRPSASPSPDDDADNQGGDQNGGVDQQGPADEQRGEAVTLDSAKAEIDAAELVGDVNNRLAALREHLSDDEGDELVTYAGARIDALKGGQ